MKFWMAPLILSLLALPAQAQVTLSNDQPVQISSDALEVLQEQSQAIFTGNVIATQGEVNMRAEKMIVHYRNSGGTAGAEGAMGKGIERIDASGNVIFTNPADTAKGDFAVYNVDKETLDLTGNVLLTRDKNILKGTHLNYNLATGRSVLTSGGNTVAGQKGGRVQGLFVPGSEK